MFAPTLAKSLSSNREGLEETFQRFGMFASLYQSLSVQSSQGTDRGDRLEDFLLLVTS